MHAPSNWLTAAVSALALVGSTVSLWESTFKHSDIKVYVSENIQYTRDPYGPFEVLAVPVTVSNVGARDGAVLSLQLHVKNLASGKAQIFKSAYTADALYFGARDRRWLSLGLVGVVLSTVARSFDPARMRIVQSGFEKRICCCPHHISAPSYHGARYRMN